MFLVLWEFEVKPSCEDRFQRIYSPGGDWDALFHRDENHLGSRLFRDVSRPGLYITMDSWNSLAAYENFLATHSAEYHQLNIACNGLTSNERYLGSFEKPDS